MRAAEQALIEAGSSVSKLMERAGRGAAEWVRRVAMGRPVTVLCGPGNNGGDGYVIARVLRESGLAVHVVAPLPPQTEAAIAAQQAWGGGSAGLTSGGVLVDALFGSGLTRPLGTALAELLSSAAREHDVRIAIDVPSGIDADTAAPLDDDLPHYNVTLALGAWKRAHWRMPAMEAMGERRLVDIGIGTVDGAARLVERPLLHAPSASAHKYTRGYLGIVGGTMPGAARLAAEAAMFGGAGYVKLFSDGSSPQPLPELVVEADELGERIADRRLDALVVGPGLGRDHLARERLSTALARDLPTVVDGDALMLLDPELLSRRREAAVLTPHAGELATLCEAFTIAGGDPLERLQALAHCANAVIIGKGPDNVIAWPDGSLRFTRGASSWLSIAGSGDVLAGLAGSRLAAGRCPNVAAEEAVWIHTRAAALAGPSFTPRGLIAALPHAFAECL
jgi:hydroxyethylthiazole kinase-like uncharacterized protein yjeF